jgi:hypothetical protein
MQQAVNKRQFLGNGSVSTPTTIEEQFGVMFLISPCRGYIRRSSGQLSGMKKDEGWQFSLSLQGRLRREGVMREIKVFSCGMFAG